MEYLIAKHCPPLMRMGGGSIEEEAAIKERTERCRPDNVRPPTKITPQILAKMIELYQPPREMGITEIAQKLDIAASTVVKNLRKAGAWENRGKKTFKP